MSEPSSPAVGTPRSVRAAVGIWLALAAFTVFHLVYLLLNQAGPRSALAARGMSAEQIDSVLSRLTTDGVVAAVVFGGALVLFALRLRSARPRSATGLTVTSVSLVLVTLFGGDWALCVVSLLLSVFGLVFTWHPATRRWQAAVREAD